MNVLGIETSCDETAAAVVADGRGVYTNIVSSQIELHRPYGGVVPELASRQHVENLPAIVEEAVSKSPVGWSELNRIAVTYGPGLASSLMVGLSAAKALALSCGIPLVGINHLEAHLYSVFLGDDVAFSPEEACPMLILLVSGGHTCLVRMNRIGDYELLGQTLDDAAGEALDKGATLLNLSYPGGPAIEEAAVGGDPCHVRFPRGLEKKNHSPHCADRRYCFSFSGLKTSLFYYVKKHPEVVQDQAILSHVAASYQEAVCDTLLSKTRDVLTQERGYKSLACVGGVAKNRTLRTKLDELAGGFKMPLHLAELAYCTDNAAMIAALAGRGEGVEVSADFKLDVSPNLGLASVL